MIFVMINVLKKFVYCLFIYALFFFNYSSVFADDGVFSASVSGSDFVNKGETAKILINLKYPSAISSCSIEVDADDSLELVSTNSLLEKWSVSKSDGKIHIENVNSDKTAFTSGKNVVALNYKVNSTGRVRIAGYSCSLLDDDGIGSMIAGSSSQSYPDVSGIKLTVKDNIIVNPATGEIKSFILIVVIITSVIYSFLYLRKIKKVNCRKL